MNIILAKNNVHFGIMFIFKNSEQNAVFPMFIVLPGILLFCSLILSYVFLLSYFWIFLSVIRNFEWFLGLILSYFYLALLYSILSAVLTHNLYKLHT